MEEGKFPTECSILERFDERNLPPPSYYDWRDTFPELHVLQDNFDVILEEMKKLSEWTAWPENHYTDGGASDWKVFPFLHTFPAFEPENAVWVESTCAACPKTVAILKAIPGIKTALFSRLGPNTKISAHTGWAELANYVLRCHLCLTLPSKPENCCGLWVNGVEAYHRLGEIVVFDDSLPHKAYNNSEQDRVVLIVDLERPEHLPLGSAKGTSSPELINLINAFK